MYQVIFLPLLIKSYSNNILYIFAKTKRKLCNTCIHTFTQFNIYTSKIKNVNRHKQTITLSLICTPNKNGDLKNTQTT